MRVLAILVVLSMAFAAAACGGGTADVPAEQPAAGEAAVAPEATAVPEQTLESDAEAPAAADVTMAQYEQVAEGMTYDEVVSILGEPSQELSSSEVMGIKSVMYQWNGAAPLSNMTGMFQDGKLISKAQFGLE